jgi:uncharacterized protein (TIRG00374 family)
MKITLKDVIQLVISLGLGVLIFYLVYKGLNIAEMKGLISKANYGYLLMPIVLCILSSVVRALRWNMLIEPLGKKPSLRNTFCAVMYGYFINHLFPRAGEIARCGVLKKYEGISFTELVGTVITERAFDLIVTLLIVFTSVVVEFDVFKGVISQVSVFERIGSVLSSPLLWVCVAAFVLLLFILRKWINQLTLMGKIKKVMAGILNGLKSFTKVKNKPLFLVYSVLIFFIYYLMLYTSFKVFSFTSGLGPEAGLTTYVFGALGMLVPVQGGIGTYEFMTIQALLIYGISATQGGAFAVLAHLVEIIVNSVVGFGCSMALPFINRGKNQNGEQEQSEETKVNQ